MKKEIDISSLRPRIVEIAQTKESYLAWRAQFRKDYQAVSLDIRSARRCLANCYRAHDNAQARTNLNILSRSRQEARLMLAVYAEMKLQVRLRLRAAGFNAPSPILKPAPAPRLKPKLTPEQIEFRKAQGRKEQQGVENRLAAAKAYHTQYAV